MPAAVCKPLGAHCGIVLEAAPGGLAEVDDGLVRREFRDRGLIVFRGHRVDPAAFAAFAGRFTAAPMVGYGRVPFPDQPLITMNNESSLPLAPHSDNGLRPDAQRPQITWFHCQIPSESGGETTFYDGTLVWPRLAPATRSLLERTRISFVSLIAEAAWSKAGFPSAQAFAAFVPQIGGAPLAIQPDGAVVVEVLAPAVRPAAFGGQPAYVSCLAIAGSTGFEAMTVRLEGGAPIPPEVTHDIEAALASCCDELTWQPDDVAMLDNSRFLHGRRAYGDMRRRLYLLQTLRANFA